MAIAPLSAGSSSSRKPPRPARSTDVEGSRLGPYALVYGTLTLVAAGITAADGRSLLYLPTEEAWLRLDGYAGAVTSLVGGVVLAFATIKATVYLVRHRRWARALHASLRPTIRGLSNPTLLLLGVGSAVGEELFFRGWLATEIGVIASSCVFGLLHQMRGRDGWSWSGWAMLMGLLFGSLFLATGSLLGPLVAHAAINVTNLRFVRDTDVERHSHRDLGGLLRRT